MPRLTHHKSAQLITTGTMISSCNAPSLRWASARTAGAACSDANSTTDLHAGVGAVGLDETRTIGGARIAGTGAFSGSTLPEEVVCRASGCWTAQPPRPAASQPRGQGGCFASSPFNRLRGVDASGRTGPPRPSGRGARLLHSCARFWRRARIASRKLAGNTIASSVVIFAPVADKSSTMHWRVAKPPSKVIHPGWRSDLRGSRGFISASISLAPARIPQNWIPVVQAD